MKFNRVRKFVRQGKLIDAIDETIAYCEQTELFKNLDTLFHLSGRYYELLKNKASLDSGDYFLFYNKISKALLEELNEIESIRMTPNANRRKRKILAPSPLFTGRENELSELRERIKHYSIIHISGISGVGKTQLIAKFVNEINKQEFDINWVNFNESISVDSFFHLLGFGNALVVRGYNKNQKKDILVELLNRKRSIFIIDDFHLNKNPEILDILEHVSKYLRESKIIILSQSKDFTSKHTFNIEIEGLGTDAAKFLMKNLESIKDKTYTETHLKKFCADLSGHPLSIELFGVFLTEKFIYDHDFSLEEVFIEYQLKKGHEILSLLFGKDIDDEFITRMLSLLSIARTPLSANLIEDILGESYDENILHYLVYRHYVIHANGRFRLHSLIREFFVLELGSSENSDLHLQLANNLVKQRSASELDVQLELEIAYHYQCSNNEHYLEKLIKNQSERYLMSGYGDQLEKLVSELKNEKIEEVDLNIIRARIAKWKTDYRSSFKYFNAVIQGSDDNDHFNVDALLESAMLYYQLRKNAAGFKNLYLGFNRARKNYYSEGMAKALNMCAILFKDAPTTRSEKEKLLKLCLQISQLAIDITTEQDQGFLLPMYYNTRGRLFQKQEKYSSAIAHFKKARELAKTSGNVEFEVSSTTNIGTCIFNSGAQQKLGKENTEQAMDHHLEALDIYHKKNVHSYGTLCLIYNNLSISESANGRRRETIHYLNRLFYTIKKSKMQNSGSATFTIFAVSLVAFHIPSIIRSSVQVFIAIKDVLLSVAKSIVSDNGLSYLNRTIREIQDDLAEDNNYQEFRKIATQLKSTQT